MSIGDDGLDNARVQGQSGLTMIQHLPPLRFRRPRLSAAAVLVGAAVVGMSLGPNSDAALPDHVVTRRVNVPYLVGQPFEPAIFWFGRVGMTENYADVRVRYYDASIRFSVHIPDRVLWHDSQPNSANLTAWDAVSIYIDVGGNSGQAPGQSSYWFVKQLRNAQAVFRGDGQGWVPDTVPFTASDAWRGNSPNDDVWDSGWEANFDIPFSSLGLTTTPPSGTLWGLGAVIHDRDDAVGTTIPDQVWPESLQTGRPETWGQLAFGRPAHNPATTAVDGTTIIRQGLNGAVVPDAAVGGHTICGSGMNAWTEWGNANYAGYIQFNIQNQWDISDFMCFSKYYVTVPLTSIPVGRSIISAHLTLTLFGNAGYVPGDAKPSAINALTVSEDWSESSITWNNAPYATENVSVTWVYPVDATHPAGPYRWDVSYAVDEAYRNGRPLRLVFYSTDGDYHSGKYFYTSDSNDWGGTVRPTLEVNWGASSEVTPAAPTGLRIIRRP